MISLAGILLCPLLGRAGEISLEVLDLKQNIHAVFLDWDKTLTTGGPGPEGLSEEVRKEACDGMAYPDCPCVTQSPSGPINNCGGDPKMMTEAFYRKFTKADMVAEFGGEARLNHLRETLKKLRERLERKVLVERATHLRETLDANVYVVSTSWYPMDEEQWREFLVLSSKELDLGFKPEDIITLADPGKGKSANKGAAIKAKMQEIVKQSGGHVKMPLDSAVFADDSSSNIATAKDVCATLYLPERKGLSQTDQAYLKTLAYVQLPWKPAITVRPAGQNWDDVFDRQNRRGGAREFGNFDRSRTIARLSMDWLGPGKDGCGKGACQEPEPWMRSDPSPATPFFALGKDGCGKGGCQEPEPWLGGRSDPVFCPCAVCPCNW